MLLTQSGLSKSKLISHLQCEKKLWLSTYKSGQAKHDQAALTRMERGNILGAVARSIFPGGSLVDTNDRSSAVAKTKSLLKTNSGPIYEAAFTYDGILVFIDILVPEEDGYHLIEIKSATEVSTQHIIDTAIQVWVAERTGAKINRVSVGFINNKFVYPGEKKYDGLFKLKDISNDISTYSPIIEGWVRSARDILSNSDPLTPIGKQCKSPFECEFQDYCKSLAPNLPKYPLSDLKLKKLDLKKLEDKGYTNLLEVPIELVEDPKKARLHRSILSGENYVSENAKTEIDAIPYPRYYLDFETIAHGLPEWPGTRPYQQIPFQWSCHIEHSDGHIEHQEFLAEPTQDPRKDCMTSLMSLFDGFKHGSMIAYHAGFEKRILRDLAKLYPETQLLFNSICNQTYDLLPICRNNFYNRDMHGLWSIKHVLPAIAPDLNYQALEIANGQMAQTAFVKMCAEGLSDDEIIKLRADLLKYCKLDTLAMVKIVRYFCERP
jgi:hypothetical protein